ncbi:thioredoxin [Nonomuraea roseoviolacea]|uniref:Thioredoxin n=1 Tax=Nonomuraea roseoviolacea subsp. carminata TaxID=160689 RepID=A0ABT1K118_9ACTN|nr:thioredoxin [Nonomuraea roseoviolacea]MCP2347701.1 thioredoxin 1 [Nonomuraea roseoviolacea subsp. carminata]
MITLTTVNFDEQVLRADKPVLVDFWAEWCGPCRMVAPVLQQIESEYGLTIGKLNTDENPEIMSRYGVLSLPTLLLFENGEPVRQVVGAKPKRMLVSDLGLA